MSRLNKQRVEPETDNFAAEFASLKRYPIVVSEEEFEWFMAELDAPPKDDPRLARALATKAPWEK